MSELPPTKFEWQMVSIMQRQRKELDELRATLKTIIDAYDWSESYPEEKELKAELSAAVMYGRQFFERKEP